MLKDIRPWKLRMSRQRLYTIREGASHGDYPKDVTMREHLALAGWRKVADEYWQ